MPKSNPPEGGSLWKMRTTKRTQEGGFTGFQLKVYSEAERKQGDEGRKCLKEVGRSSPEFGNYWTDLPPGGAVFECPITRPLRRNANTTAFIENRRLRCGFSRLTGWLAPPTCDTKIIMISCRSLTMRYGSFCALMDSGRYFENNQSSSAPGQGYGRCRTW